MNSVTETTANDRRAMLIALAFGVVVILAIVLYAGVVGMLALLAHVSPVVHLSLLLLPAPICGGVGYWLGRRGNVSVSATVVLVLLSALVAPFIALNIVQYFGFLGAAVTGKSF